VSESVNRQTITDANFFADRDIRDWPRVVVFAGGDALLEVGKGYSDAAQQDVQVTLFSSGYHQFLYANQQDWLSGEFNLPRFAQLKSSRGASSVGTACYTLAFDAAVLVREISGFMCISEAYRFPEPLQPIPFNYIGPARFQGFLKTVAETVCDPESMLPAFRHEGFITKSLVADDSIYHMIYLALAAGREPAEVIECLPDFDISNMRENIESFVKRAHGRMNAAGGIVPGPTAASTSAQALHDMPRYEGGGRGGQERVASSQPIVSPEVGMDPGSFWKIIQETRAGARDDEHFLRRIVPRLKKMSPDELMQFEALRSKLGAQAYSWALWGAAYLMTGGGCLDDCFNCFRAWLMSQGRKTFENALKDPDTLADLDNPGTLADPDRLRVIVREFEEFMAAASEIYETKTDDEMPEAIYEGVALPELGERWDFDDGGEMKKRYPKLFAKYHEQ